MAKLLRAADVFLSEISSFFFFGHSKVTILRIFALNGRLTSYITDRFRKTKK